MCRGKMATVGRDAALTKFSRRRADAGVGGSSHPRPTSAWRRSFMQYRQGYLLQTLQVMEQAIETRPELKPLIGTTAQLGLIAVIGDLTTHSSSQKVNSLGSRGETARARSLRAALRAIHLQPIVSAARICATQNPALQPIAMPSHRLSTPALLAETTGIIETAHANEQQLIAAGLPPTFLRDIDAAMTKLKASLEDRAHFGSRRTGATEGIAITERRARDVVKIVDAQARALIGDNAALLAEWSATIRQSRKPGLTAGSAKPENTSTTSTTTTVAA